MLGVQYSENGCSISEGGPILRRHCRQRNTKEQMKWQGGSDQRKAEVKAKFRRCFLVCGIQIIIQGRDNQSVRYTKREKANQNCPN
jgi:hypothetical protein